MVDIEKDLDLLEEQKINITRRMKDYTQLAVKESMFTRTFQGPVTAKNQALLENYGILGAESTFNPHKGILASWSFSMFTKFVGRLEVNSVVYKDGDPIMFNFTFYGKQKGLATVFGTDRFSDVNWSDFDHTLTIDNVKDSWDGLLENGDILYPLIDNGRGYFMGPASLNLAGNIRNENNPILLTDLKPAIRFSTLIKHIFSEYGLTIGGDILNDVNHDYHNLFVLINRYSGTNVTAEQLDENFTSYNEGTSDELTAVGQESIVTIPTVVQDENNNWDGTTYTADIDATHLFDFFATVRMEDVAFSPTKGVIDVRKNGTTVQTFEYDEVFGDLFFNLFLSGIQIFLIQGDEVTFHFRREEYEGQTGRNMEIISNLGFTSFRASTPTNQVGQLMSLNNQMTDQKLVEWMGDFFRSKNWILKPDEFDDTTWTLISQEEDRDNGHIRDWSDFLDLKNVLVEKPEVYKEISFTYQESESAVHQTYKNIARKGFGDLHIRPDVDFGKGKLEIKNPCTIIPPAIFQIVDSNGEQIGQTADITIHKSLDQAGSPVNEQNLLFFYNGKQPTVYTWYLQSGISFGEVVAQSQTKYPRISSFKGFADDPSDVALGYSLESTVEGLVPSGTTYERFWESDIVLKYDPASRVLKNIRLVLPPSEFYTYQLNDEIFLQNEYWKIVEIKHDKDGKQAKATLESSRRLKPLNKVQIGAGGKVNFDFPPDGLEKSAAGAYKKGNDFYGSFLVAQIVPDLQRYNEIITQVTQEITNEINEINGRFRSYSEQS